MAWLAGFLRLTQRLLVTMGFWPETCAMKHERAAQRGQPLRFQDTGGVKGFWGWGLGMLLRKLVEFF